jgi:hypothetical protein
MRTTVAIRGTAELVLDKAVRLGLARSKTDALRMGIFSLNREYNLVKDIEMEMVAGKLSAEEKEMQVKGQRYLSKEKALAKYR